MKQLKRKTSEVSKFHNTEDENHSKVKMNRNFQQTDSRIDDSSTYTKKRNLGQHQPPGIVTKNVSKVTGLKRQNSLPEVGSNTSFNLLIHYSCTTL